MALGVSFSVQSKSCIACVWEWLQNPIKLGLAESHLEFLYLQAGGWELNWKPLEIVWACEAIVNNTQSFENCGWGGCRCLWRPEHQPPPTALPVIALVPQLPSSRLCSLQLCWLTCSPGISLHLKCLKRGAWHLIQCPYRVEGMGVHFRAVL